MADRFPTPPAIMRQPMPGRTGKKIGAGLGAATATAAMIAAVAHYAAPKTAPFEGFVSCPYVDKIGRGRPWTEGYGHTGPDVKPGHCISKAEGLRILQRDEEIAARKALVCSPQYVVDSQPLWGAATDFALNTGYYCKGPSGRPTMMARRFAVGDARGGCDAFNAYVFSANKRVNGLVRRRVYFSGDCAKGIPYGLAH